VDGGFRHPALFAGWGWCQRRALCIALATAAGLQGQCQYGLGHLASFTFYIYCRYVHLLAVAIPWQDTSLTA